MDETINVAFAGCTHPHIFYRLALLRNTLNVKIVGCYDPDPGLRKQFEQKQGLRVFASAEELLDQPGVNFVIIEGVDTDNPDYVRMAARRNQAILLEKPGAPDLPAMRSLVRDLQENPVPFQVAYQLRFSPVITHIRRILDSGVLGPITLARFHAATPVGAGREPWQSVPGDMGGVVYTDGCHMIHLIVHLLGTPHRVSAMLLSLPEGPPVVVHDFKEGTFARAGEAIDMPLGGLMYEDGGVALLDYGDRLVTFDMTGWEAHPWVESWRIEIYGTDGSLYAGLQPPWYRLYVRIPRAGYEPGWHSWQGDHMPRNTPVSGVNINYTREMQHMLARVRAWDTDNTIWLDEAEAVVTVLDGFFRSHQEGLPVQIEVTSS